jgi:hypothetical protein
LEAKGSDVVILGNGKAEKYDIFEMTIEPSVNNLDP